jgi:SAM-dependent methyltransferase
MDIQLKKILTYPLWRQSVDLGNGYKTPGHVERTIWEFIGLPENVKDKSFLDVGANDGLFSFEAEKRGAAEIVSSDLYKEGIDTMKNGWSNEGISMLKSYFNSKIELHSKGIYHLTELKRKFDVVIVNDIINWLEDIEHAFKELGEVAKDVLYISDGFILDDSKPMQTVPEKMPMRHMYNLSFIKALLEKNGFAVESVIELNYQKVFLKDFVSFPIIKLLVGTKIHTLPTSDSEYKLSDSIKEEKCNSVTGEFYHIYNIGWVHKNDAKVMYNEPSKFYKLAKSLSILHLYFKFLQNRHKKSSKITAYTIKAVKRNSIA